MWIKNDYKVLQRGSYKWLLDNYATLTDFGLELSANQLVNQENINHLLLITE